MSGLAAVLAGREPSGLYRWEAAFTVEDLTSTLEVARWSVAHLDGAYAQTKAEVLAGLGSAFDFPEHYGRNLDALADCLADLAGDTVLLWDDWAAFARGDERAFGAIRRILAARAAEPGPSLLVLLRGEGPDLDVPLLD